MYSSLALVFEVCICVCVCIHVFVQSLSRILRWSFSRTVGWFVLLDEGLGQIAQTTHHEPLRKGYLQRKDPSDGAGWSKDLGQGHTISDQFAQDLEVGIDQDLQDQTR